MKYVLFKEVSITPELSPWDMFYRSDGKNVATLDSEWGEET